MARAAAARVAPAGPSHGAAPARRRATAAVAAPARKAAPRGRPTPTRRPAPVRPAAPRAIAGRARALARSRAAAALESVLHGHGLIAIVFVLLVGVVFANVALLQRNRQITHDAARVSELKRENATLRRDVAEIGSSERIQQVAAERGLVLPAPDAVRYLRSNPRVDALAAAKSIDAGAALAAVPDYTPPAYAAPAPTATDSTVYGTTPTYDAYGNPVTGTEIAGTPDAVADVTAGVP